ncbi:hypothetical protein EBT25_06950 [bacterium]|nr:hypothetical protein [bacterium]
MLARILIGFAIGVAGFFMVWKTDFFYGLLGSVPWADRTFGGGGTRLFYKLLGTTIIIVGVMVMTNSFEIIVGGFIRSLFAF